MTARELLLTPVFVAEGCILLMLTTLRVVVQVVLILLGISLLCVALIIACGMIGVTTTWQICIQEYSNFLTNTDGNDVL